MNPYRSKIYSGIMILVLALGLLWIWSSRIPPGLAGSKVETAPQVGFAYPPFELKTISGASLSPADLRNRPLVINFWASWCPPCRAEMPDFQTAAEEYAATDLVIAAINTTDQDSLADVLDFIETNQLTFPVLLDDTGAAARDYLVHSLPSTFFVNREGIITNVIIGGPIPLPAIRVEIENILQE